MVRKLDACKIKARFTAKELLKADQHGASEVLAMSVIDNIALNVGWAHFTALYREKLPVDKLRQSLASVLHLFPTFTGRLVEVQGGGWYGINTNNRGIDFLTGTSPDTLECIMPPPRVGGGMWVLADGAPLCSIRLADLAPALYAGRDWPLVRVSVVHLADGGTALTVSMFHVVGDFASIRSLFQQWSAAFSSRPLKEQPTPYDRAVLEGLASKGGLDETALRMYVRRPLLIKPRFAASALNNWFLRGGGMTGMLSFHISAERLRELKELATADVKALGGKDGELWVSSNDALVARMWQVLSQLPCRKGASFQPAVCVDVRSRTGLPEQTIGNFVFWALPDTVDAAKQSLGQLALSVRGAIQRMPEETAQSLAWAKGRDPNSLWVSTAIPGPSSFISNTGCFTYTNWSISDSDVSFGAAAPAWYVPHTQLLPRVAVVWPAPQAVGGQVLSVVLTRKEGKQLAKMLPGGL